MVSMMRRKGTKKPAPPITYERPDPGPMLPPPGEANLIKCQADPMGCPNRATHWLVVDGQRQSVACNTCAARAVARKTATAEKFA